MAAIIYQIAWQRVLFTSFGVNIESVTIIVSVFMFGLGVGSLLGGQLSKKYFDTLPHLFFILEIVIGAFGLISMPLIKWVTLGTLHMPLLVLPLVIYGILVVPTMAMGATLPILVAYLHRETRLVGQSVSTLYSMNTLGSALSCFLTVLVLFRFLNLSTTILFAALINFTVGFLVFRYMQGLKPAGAAP